MNFLSVECVGAVAFVYLFLFIPLLRIDYSGWSIGVKMVKESIKE